MRYRLIKGLMDKIPHTKLNGPIGDKRLPNNVKSKFYRYRRRNLIIRLRL